MKSWLRKRCVSARLCPDGGAEKSPDHVASSLAPAADSLVAPLSSASPPMLGSLSATSHAPSPLPAGALLTGACE